MFLYKYSLHSTVTDCSYFLWSELELIKCALIKRRENVLWPMAQSFDNADNVNQLCQKLKQ